jgi:L-threonylcarbamoyladenylate synthase
VSDDRNARLVAVDPAVPAAAVLREAAILLRRGDLVAFPTETFYGLGAAALDRRAVKRIFDLKGRADAKPLLALVDSVAMAETVARVTGPARAMMARHWPGALTIVLAARDGVPAELTAGTGTIGLRASPHPVALGLVRAFGAPVTAPSANPSGGEPPVTAAGVLGYFPEGIALVLDGGPTAGGAPSTVLDMTVDPPRILRQGVVQLPASELAR